jgi:hypothetical protein
MSVAGLHSARRSLLEAVRGVDAVACRIPGAEDPVDLTTALRWLERSVVDGFAVDFRVVRSDGEAEVAMLRWDPAEVRPDWPEDWPDSDEVREPS